MSVRNDQYENSSSSDNNNYQNANNAQNLANNGNASFSANQNSYNQSQYNQGSYNQQQYGYNQNSYNQNSYNQSQYNRSSQPSQYNQPYFSQQNPQYNQNQQYSSNQTQANRQQLNQQQVNQQQYGYNQYNQNQQAWQAPQAQRFSNQPSATEAKSPSYPNHNPQAVSPVSPVSRAVPGSYNANNASQSSYAYNNSYNSQKTDVKQWPDLWGDSYSSSASDEITHNDSNPKPVEKSDELNKCAFWGLILAFFFPVVGFILSVIALSQIRKTGERGRVRAWIAIVVSILIVILAINGLANHLDAQTSKYYYPEHALSLIHI